MSLEDSFCFSTVVATGVALALSEDGAGRAWTELSRSSESDLENFPVTEAHFRTKRFIALHWDSLREAVAFSGTSLAPSSPHPWRSKTKKSFTLAPASSCNVFLFFVLAWTSSSSFSSSSSSSPNRMCVLFLVPSRLCMKGTSKPLSMLSKLLTSDVTLPMGR